MFFQANAVIDIGDPTCIFIKIMDPQNYFSGVLHRCLEQKTRAIGS